jgi:hypothetical protein
MAKNIVICDIDLTILDSRHRHGVENPSDDLVLADEPILPVIEVIEHLMADETMLVMFSTGRPQSMHAVTRTQLTAIGLEHYSDLWMRQPSQADHADWEVKQANLARIGVSNVLCAFDDKKSCVDMYRAAGLNVFHCKLPTA